MLTGLHYFTPSSFTTFSAVMAWTLALLAPVFIYRLVCVLKSIKNLWVVGVWCALAAFYFGLLLAFFPGFVSYDDAFTFNVLTSGKVWAWQSLTYSWFLSAGLMLFGSLAFTTVVSILIFLFLAAKVLKMIDDAEISQRTKIIIASVLILLALHPLNQGLLLFQTRDVLFSLLLTYLGLQFFEAQPGRLKLLMLTALIVILGDLRQEAKIYLLIVPALFIILKKWSWRQLGIFTVMAFAGGLIYYKILPKIFEANSYSFDYQVTAYVLPLSQIFHDVPPEEIPEIHRANIDAVFSVDALRNDFNPVDIDPFHRGGLKHHSTPAEQQKFHKSARELFFIYPEMVLKNRIYLMKSMMNIGQRWPLFFDDCLRTCGSERFEFRQPELADPQKYTLSPTALKYQKWLESSIDNKNVYAYVFNSFLLPMLFLCVALTGFFWYPALAAFAAVVAARLPVLFLLAPAGYLKYIYSVFLFFTFGVVLIFLKAAVRKVSDGKP